MLLRVLTLAAVAAGGWVVGSIWPAPASVLSHINKDAIERRVRAEMHTVEWDRLQGMMSEQDLARFTDEVARTGAAAGQLIQVEHADLSEIDVPDWIPASTGAPARPPAAPATASAPPAAGATTTTPASTAAAFEAALTFCPGMTIANRPIITPYRPVVTVNNVRIAVNPTTGACLSSGFGPRGTRQHKGVDYHSQVGGPILAAGDGTIVEMKYRDDYGNMLLIDHDNGVYTRYAHLSNFARDLRVGGRVTAGQQIGLMGNTASYAIPIHLHYELLLGDYNTPRQSFGLTPHSPFEYRS